MREFEFLAYAKINLFLEVCGKREDGYHDILTIFARISLADRLVFRKRDDGKINIVLKNNVNVDNLSKEENLVWKAAKAFCEVFGIRDGFDIYLEKNIPAGAGLGGGSSDCAKTLEALSLIYNVDKSRVFDIARSLGSDVSFFLSGFSFALGSQRGEVVERIDLSAKMPDVVVVFPGVAISTKGIYSSMRYDYKPRYDLLESFLEELKKPDNRIDFSRYLFNRLEIPAFNLERRIEILKKEMIDCGLDALMSGSGSCVFGLSYDEGVIERAVKVLRGKYNFVFKAKFV